VVELAEGEGVAEEEVEEDAEDAEDAEDKQDSK